MRKPCKPIVRKIWRSTGLICLYRGLDRRQSRASLARDSALCNQIEEFRFKRCRRIEMADLHFRGAVAELLKCRFHRVITQYFADPERILGQNGNDPFHRNDFDVPLDTGVLPAREVALIPNARFAECLAVDEINLEHARINSGFLRDPY